MSSSSWTREDSCCDQDYEWRTRLGVPHQVHLDQIQRFQATELGQQVFESDEIMRKTLWSRGEASPLSTNCRCAERAHTRKVNERWERGLTEIQKLRIAMMLKENKEYHAQLASNQNRATVVKSVQSTKNNKMKQCNAAVVAPAVTADPGNIPKFVAKAADDIDIDVENSEIMQSGTFNLEQEQEQETEPVSAAASDVDSEHTMIMTRPREIEQATSPVSTEASLIINSNHATIVEPVESTEDNKRAMPCIYNAATVQVNLQCAEIIAVTGQKELQSSSSTMTQFGDSDSENLAVPDAAAFSIVLHSLPSPDAVVIAKASPGKPIKKRKRSDSARNKQQEKKKSCGLGGHGGCLASGR